MLHQGLLIYCTNDPSTLYSIKAFLSYCKMDSTLCFMKVFFILLQDAFNLMLQQGLLIYCTIDPWTLYSIKVFLSYWKVDSTLYSMKVFLPYCKMYSTLCFIKVLFILLQDVFNLMLHQGLLIYCTHGPPSLNSIKVFLSYCKMSTTLCSIKVFWLIVHMILQPYIPSRSFCLIVRCLQP